MRALRMFYVAVQTCETHEKKNKCFTVFDPMFNSVQILPNVIKHVQTTPNKVGKQHNMCHEFPVGLSKDWPVFFFFLGGGLGEGKIYPFCTGTHVKGVIAFKRIIDEREKVSAHVMQSGFRNPGYFCLWNLGY